MAHHTSEFGGKILGAVIGFFTAWFKHINSGEIFETIVLAIFGAAFGWFTTQLLNYIKRKFFIKKPKDHEKA